MSEKRLSEFLESSNSTLSSEDYLVQMKSEIETILNNSDFKKELEFHSALANKQRLLIMKILDKEDMCNCAIAEVLGVAEGSLTHHLKKLTKAGLIIAQKEGRFTIFTTRDRFLAKIQENQI